MTPWKTAGLPLKASLSISLQWGHGDDAVEDAPLLGYQARGPHRFNGATAMTPWKTWPAATASSTSRAGFNGATAMTPWKTAFLVDGVEPVGAASMGPRR